MSNLNVSNINDRSVDNSTVKAWANLDGSGTISLRDSFNISSVVDNGGAGDYTFNFANPFASGNYAWAGSAGFTSGNYMVGVENTSSQLAGSSRMDVYNGANTQSDVTSVLPLFVGDTA